MFLGAKYQTVLLEILSDVTGSQKFKMAASNRLPCPQKYGVAVKISLLDIRIFRLEAAILDF